MLMLMLMQEENSAGRRHSWPSVLLPEWQPLLVLPWWIILNIIFGRLSSSSFLRIFLAEKSLQIFGVSPVYWWFFKYVFDTLPLPYTHTISRRNCSSAGLGRNPQFRPSHVRWKDDLWRNLGHRRQPGGVCRDVFWEQLIHIWPWEKSSYAMTKIQFWHGVLPGSTLHFDPRWIWSGLVWSGLSRLPCYVFYICLLIKISWVGQSSTGAPSHEHFPSWLDRPQSQLDSYLRNCESHS